MSLRFELAYLLGYAPWDRWGDLPWRQLRALFEGAQAIRPGRALDIGCGRGLGTIYLAELGWQAVGIDPVERALQAGRRRAKKAGVQADFVKADISRLAEDGVKGPFDLFLDLGCFHCLTDEQRKGYGPSIAQVASAEAEMVMFAFGHHNCLTGPRGAERKEIEQWLEPGWHITWSAPETSLPFWTPKKNVTATWYRLKRRPLAA
jgi:cyclopropane fatty-acyl-phospholipid synthase-like methyltransferase